MINFMWRLLIFLCLTVISSQVWGGTWSPNNFLYKPTLGARGAAEKASFDGGLDRLDARLGKETWVGDPNYGPTLWEALDAIGNTNTILRVPAGTHSVSASLTVPSNVALKLERGATLAIADGRTLTINGPLMAGRYQIFSCSGTGKVVFGEGAVDEAYPEWWAVNTTPGTTDMTAAIQAAFRAYPIVKLADTSYAVDNSTVYLDSTDNDLTYNLKGSGKGTFLKLNNFASGYAFKLNEDSGGSRVLFIPRHPRLVVEDLVLDGSGSASTSFLWVNTASAQFNRVRMTGLLYGCRPKDGTYNDNIAFRDVYWHNPVAGGWMYYNGTANGDGFIAEHVFAAQKSDTIWLRKCMGASFRAGIGGLVKIESCVAVTYENNHQEETGGVSLEIIDSHITVRNNSLFNSDLDGTTYPIKVNDSVYYHASRIVFEDNRFLYLGRSALPLRVPDIYLAAVSNMTHIILRNNTAVNQQQSAAGGTRWAQDSNCGIIVTAADGTLNTYLGTMKRVLSSDVELFRKNNVWTLRPVGGGEFRFMALTSPGLAYTAAAAYYGNLTVGTTYYYQMAVWNGAGWSNIGTERSATPTLGNQSIIHSVAARAPYVLVRMWRGTAPTVYDRYVDIPFAKSDASTLTDHGDHVEGFAWITAGVPTPPTADNTMNGVVHENGYRTFWATAAPASAEFSGAVGDRVVRVPPAVGQPKAWSCTASGDPGTWTSEENL